MGVPEPIIEKIIFTNSDITPSKSDLEVIGCCNPGGVLFKRYGEDIIYLLIRVIEKKKKEAFPGHIGSPRALINSDKYDILWEYEREEKDANYDVPYSLVTTENEERIRPTTISHFRLAESRDGINFKIHNTPIFFPNTNYEEFGIEDARITKLDEPISIDNETYEYIITYVACSENYDVCTAFCATNDFIKFTRLPKNNPGIIFSPPSKDVVLFPKKFFNPRTKRKEFLALTRPIGQARYMVPSIFISYSHDLFQWGDYQLLIKGDEKGHVGAGPTPIELNEGWLIIDHQHRHLKGDKKEYIGRAYIIDKENPLKILKKSEEFLEPHLHIPGKPIVDNVTFPSAAIIREDKLYIYTGENDAAVAVHVYKLEDFIKFLKKV
jgi:predicted GH43/DUF377 family glycosyl hydrolase